MQTIKDSCGPELHCFFTSAISPDLLFHMPFSFLSFTDLTKFCHLTHFSIFLLCCAPKISVCVFDQRQATLVFKT
jgi:hypothetical protein